MVGALLGLPGALVLAAGCGPDRPASGQEASGQEASGVGSATGQPSADRPASDAPASRVPMSPVPLSSVPPPTMPRPTAPPTVPTDTVGTIAVSGRVQQTGACTTLVSDVGVRWVLVGERVVGLDDGEWVRVTGRGAPELSVRCDGAPLRVVEVRRG